MKIENIHSVLSEFQEKNNKRKKPNKMLGRILAHSIKKARTVL